MTPEQTNLAIDDLVCLAKYNATKKLALTILEALSGDCDDDIKFDDIETICNEILNEHKL